VLHRAPSGALVLGAVASVQFGSAVAATLFHQVGPGGAVFLRLCSATIVVTALWRPRLRSRDRSDLVMAAIFGLVLAGMNASFYEALHRIPLGIAVTIEFVRPLGVAVVGSRRPLDVVWVGLAAAGILALTHGQPHHLDALGVAFALTAGICWAGYILLNARLGRDGGVGGLLVLGQGLSARSLGGIALVIAASIGASRPAREAPVAV
jgi:inner membrane transporter RhtA